MRHPPEPLPPSLGTALLRGHLRVASFFSASPAVAQPCVDAIDGQVDGAYRARVAVATAVAPQQRDLQVVQRVEVGKAVADRAGERGVVGEELARPGDGEELALRLLPFAGDARKHLRPELR